MRARPPLHLALLAFSLLAAGGMTLAPWSAAAAKEGSEGSGSSGGGSSGGSGSGNGSSGGSSGGSGGASNGSSGSGSSGSASATQPEGSARIPHRNAPMRDHDLARQAVSRGQAVPLADILPTVRAASPGDVLDVQMGKLPSGRFVYDVTVLTRTGQYRTIRVDANSNRILDGGNR